MSIAERYGISDQEARLTKRELEAYILKSCRELWGVRKGFHAAYDAVQAQSLLAQEKPGLFARYKDLVHADRGEEALSQREDAALEQLVSKSERILVQLETLAKSYVTTGQAQTFVDGMTRVIQDRPDLYEAHARSVQQDTRSRREAVRVQKVVR